ncbi:protein AATF-like isoform X2 [Ostrea edulis]|uniref:protein AATF-like isoform X2 n=1 Tax=Ostrea edulis TaxID=37623 RepID=UPI0024AF9B97|nr:protein AATF-like isoform X2 [Ostrea edulis]
MSLREEIAKLTTPAPVFCDPEDDLEDVTTAKLTEKGEDNEEFSPLPASKLRRRVAVQSTDTEQKYAGRKISRQKLTDLESDDSGSEQSAENESINGEEDDDSSIEEESMNIEEEEEEEDEEDEAVDSEAEEEELSALGSFKVKVQSNTEKVEKEEEKFSFVDDGDYGKYYDSEDEAVDQSNDDDDDDDTNNDDGLEEGGEEEMEEDEVSSPTEGGVSSFSKSRLDEEIQKGEAARQQLGLWDSLLEGRIKFQKILTAVNQLPQPDTWRDFEKSGEDNFKEKASSVQRLLENLLQKLIRLQSVLLLQNSETQYIESGQKKPVKKAEDPDDEEITSESDSEETKQSTEKFKPQKSAAKRKLTMEEIPEFLAKRQKDFQSYRNNTLEKWYDKTRLLGGKISSKSFSGFEQSALKQIEQIMTDKDRLIKRTQMKRASYRVLGKTEETHTSADQEQELETERKNPEHTHDPEIFDDSDFYHQQLRELIERKTSDINDPIALSRQWLEIQRLRNKVKRKVETKASKGRKIRYHVHSKLVNFMAPKETCTWTDEARDDLFRSLFGQRSTTQAASSDESAVSR